VVLDKLNIETEHVRRAAGWALRRLERWGDPPWQGHVGAAAQDAVDQDMVAAQRAGASPAPTPGGWGVGAALAAARGRGRASGGKAGIAVASRVMDLTFDYISYIIAYEL